MNTRQAIQTTNDAAVLGVSFSAKRHRFIASLSEGCRIFRLDNCLPTFQPSLSNVDGKEQHPQTLTDGSVGVAAVLDDRYFAIVGGGKAPFASPNVLSFWDAGIGRQMNTINFHENVLDVKLASSHAAVILAERTLLYEYQDLNVQDPTPPSSPSEHVEESGLTQRALNKVKNLYSTAVNTFGLGCLNDTLLVLPAPSLGQVQLIPLPSGSKRVFRAHASELRAIALSEDGSVVATASTKGTLVRAFDTATLNQIGEFRRGVDSAVTTGLAISPGNRWLACTSDKGTLHIFDMRPNTSAHAAPAQDGRSQHRKSQSHAGHRLSAGNLDRESVSGMSGRSSPQSTNYQGSVQEYYGLRPPPLSATPSGPQAAVSAMQAFKSSSLAPRVLKDIRSVASAPYYTGSDPPHWQGGPSHSWTVAPTGHRKRVKHPVLPLPNDPTGRPPKGILAFAPKPTPEGKPHGMSNITNDEEGAVIYVIGGGSDPRWELMELLPSDIGGWTLVNRGHRKYMTRQFVD
ncbi:hypothetical protein Q7P37_001925 [Cladosporium fusiforme]